MASEVEMTPDKSFTTRFWELPVAVATMGQLTELYNAVKERNSVTRMACNAGESTIQMANAATKPIIEAASSYSLSKPIVGTVECAGKCQQRKFALLSSTYSLACDILQAKVWSIQHALVSVVMIIFVLCYHRDQPNLTHSQICLSFFTNVAVNFRQKYPCLWGRFCSYHISHSR